MGPKRTHRVGLASEPIAAHAHWMASRPRLLEVKLIARLPQRWEWQVHDGGTLVMSGYASSRETAQVEGDTALFLCSVRTYDIQTGERGF